MPHILLELLDITDEDFKKAGTVQCGFERKIDLPYAFYKGLINNIVSTKKFDRPMLIIHGDADDVVPHTDIKRFCRINPKAKLLVVKGADHRFKKEGEIEQVITGSKEFILTGDCSEKEVKVK